MCANELVGVLGLARVRDVPFRPDDLAAVGTIATVAALALRNARQFAAVEEVSQANSLFLNMAAHELRTPLSVVRGYASMLRDGILGELSGECTSAVATLQSKSDELARLVESLLTAARLEAGRSQPRREEDDLRAAVGEALDRLRPSAVCGGRGWSWSCRPVPCSCTATPILDNLLVNAVTYSPGRPLLRVSLAATPQGRAQVAVEDRGVGLRPEDQQRIFERFERVEHAELGFPAGDRAGAVPEPAAGGGDGRIAAVGAQQPGRGEPLRAGAAPSPGAAGRPGIRRPGAEAGSSCAAGRCVGDLLAGEVRGGPGLTRRGKPRDPNSQQPRQPQRQVPRRASCWNDHRPNARL